MDSKFITTALYQRHSKDFSLHQVSTGQPYKTGVFVLDFWSLRLDWNKTDTYGYEIKVTREDFLQDSKWNNYLNYCNRFYFACPTGLIKPEELDPKVGLVYINSRGGYKVIKAAVFRPVEIPNSIYKYILMHRLNKLSEKRKTREELIQDYLDDKIKSIELSNLFKSKLLDEVKQLTYINTNQSITLSRWKDIIDNYTLSEVKDALTETKLDVDLNVLQNAYLSLKREHDRLYAKKQSNIPNNNIGSNRSGEDYAKRFDPQNIL